MYRDLAVGEYLISVPSNYKYWSRNGEGYLFLHDRRLSERSVSILVFGISSELIYITNRPIHTLPLCHIIGGYGYKKFRDVWLYCPDWVDTFDGSTVSSNLTEFPYDTFCKNMTPKDLFITQEAPNVNIPPR